MVSHASATLPTTPDDEPALPVRAPQVSNMSADLPPTTSPELPPPVDPTQHLRILATGDWQLGMVANFLSPDAAALLREARVKRIDAILTLARESGAAAVLLAGDTFEFPNQPSSMVNEVAAILQRHRAVPIHAISGNHDLYGPGTVWATPQLQGVEHLHVHHEDDQVALSDAVTLWSLPVRSKHDVNPQHERLPDVRDRSGVHVVMAHGHDTAYLDLQHEDCALPIHSQQILDRGYSLLVLGHWHSWNPIGPRVLYPGTHEQTRFAERDAGQVALIDVPLDGSEPAIHRVPIGRLRWRRYTLDLSGQALPEAVSDAVRELSAEVDFLELTLTGEVALDDRLDALRRARAAVRPMVRHLTWRDETTERIELEEAMRRFELPQGLRQVQETLLSELQAAQDDDDTSDALRAELEALYAAARELGVVDVGETSGLAAQEGA